MGLGAVRQLVGANPPYRQMADEAAPVAAPATPAADPMEAAVARFEARKDAAVAEGKAGAGAPATSSTASSTTPAPAKPRAADIGALAQREWQARETEKQAKQLAGKYVALDQALSKKDLTAALNLMAEQHGVTFADFVQVLTSDKPVEKTAAETAEEVFNRKLQERDAAALQAQNARNAAEAKQREEGFRTQLQQRAEAGAEGAPDRWELTAVSGKGGEAWDIISGHYLATLKLDPSNGQVLQDGQKLSVEEALDLIETKLKEKRDARRPKQDAVNGSATGNGRNEAAGQGNSGRAVAPQFTNRATSGIPAVVGAQAVDESGLTDNMAIDRIAARLGYRL